MTDYTTNLDIALLDSNATAPEDVVSDGFEAFDAKITGTVACNFGTATLSLTKDQQAAGSIFHATVGSPGPGADCTLTFASFGIGVFAVINDTGFPLTITYSGQALTAPVLDDGSVGVFCGDGANIRAAGSGGGGTGGIVAAIQASENLAAGAIVNVWNSSGARIRNANATDNTKPAHGFVLAAVTSGNIGIFYGAGNIDTGLTGMTPGDTQFLDVTNGNITNAAPGAAGNLVQVLGVALSASKLAFAPNQGITV
jgi:hypothetical protein